MIGYTRRFVHPPGLWRTHSDRGNLSGGHRDAGGALAYILGYPGEGFCDRLDEAFEQIGGELPEASEHLRAFADALRPLPAGDREELYTRTFDINPVCSLEIGWQLFGEEYHRGALLVRLRQELRRAWDRGIDRAAGSPYARAVAAGPDESGSGERFCPGLCVRRPWKRCWPASRTSSTPTLAYCRQWPCTSAATQSPLPCTSVQSQPDRNPKEFTHEQHPPLPRPAAVRRLALRGLVHVPAGDDPAVPLAEVHLLGALSSQFLENRQHFWAMVPFHYGIIFLLVGHLVGLLIPRSVLAWNAHPLAAVRAGGVGVGVWAADVGGAVESDRAAAAGQQGPGDDDACGLGVYALLLVQVASGVGVAVVYPWGTSWYAAAAAPYLQSVFLLRPDISYVVGMPLLAQLHIVNAF
jgi:nitrate reductase gamma subunit